MKKAFTIVETLVAITILMIAISGPLTAAFRAMTASVAARDQMTANFLAQDAIEYVRNVKDNNIDSDTVGIDGTLYMLDECKGIENKCSIDTLQASPSNAITKGCDPTTGCVLYKKPDGKLTHVSSGNAPTKFKRYFYITNESSQSAQVVVDVEWQTGAYNTTHTILKNDLYYVTK